MPTAFGKPLTFTLPMMVLKQQISLCQFVYVPYESLKLATFTKLETRGFKANISASSAPVASVGFLLALLNHLLMISSVTFKNWKTINGRKLKFRYLVFDWAHTLFLESRSEEQSITKLISHRKNGRKPRSFPL
ncbi:hypothetical protein MOSE0_F00122 [Monosporozyma servazzii]